MIIGPFCTGPYWGAMNRSPPAATERDAFLTTVTEVGTRSGRETNRVTSLRTRGTGRTPASGMRPAGVATVKLYVPALPPTMSRPVCTVTVSPALNGVVGMQLAPSPAEPATTRPGWLPLLEPVPEMVPSWLAGMPRNVICVDGAAT